MAKTICMIGSLDTKGVEFAYLKVEIERRGCRTLVIDVGVLGAPAFRPEVPAEDVAAAGGQTLAALVTRRDRGEAMRVMADGAALVVKQLHAAGRFDGIISMGGGGGTAITAAAMRTLPVGFPKLLVSTLASGNMEAYVGTTDLTVMPSVVDVAGLNRVSKTIFANAAGAICGMVTGERPTDLQDKPLIAATMFGNTTRAVDHARKLLEERGYEVLVFHATGAGGRTMETLIEDGYFSAVLDLTTTEWADEVCGGVLSAGPARLEGAARNGVPQIVTPACLDMCNFWAPETVPAKWHGRRFYHWNPNVTLMRTNVEENTRLGKIFAEKLNAARGPVAVLVPMGGFSELDLPGQPFWWPEADAAFVAALKSKLRPDIPVELCDQAVNDPEFSRRATERLLELINNKQE
ncbi:MAG TPA: Tm-1-like ATP-binding domain-containing protein [Chthoniobacterales bacterium]